MSAKDIGILDDLALPPALQSLLLSIYGAGESARRAALAPWPELDFQSAVKERERFADQARADNPRRLLLERLLRQESRRFATDQPFFVAPGTTGQVRSPYPELTDAEYWLFVSLWEGETAARRELSSKYKVLGNQSALEYLRRYRQPGLSAWVDRLLHGPSGGKDPLGEVFTWHSRSRGGVYS
jgi:hypothetical protein